jgi:hypothetical protein
MFHSSYEFRLRLLPLAVLSDTFLDVGDVSPGWWPFQTKNESRRGDTIYAGQVANNPIKRLHTLR